MQTNIKENNESARQTIKNVMALLKFELLNRNNSQESQLERSIRLTFLQTLQTSMEVYGDRLNYSQYLMHENAEQLTRGVQAMLLMDRLKEEHTKTNVCDEKDEFKDQEVKADDRLEIEKIWDERNKSKEESDKYIAQLKQDQDDKELKEAMEEFKKMEDAEIQSIKDFYASELERKSTIIEEIDENGPDDLIINHEIYMNDDGWHDQDQLKELLDASREKQKNV